MFEEDFKNTRFGERMRSKSGRLLKYKRESNVEVMKHRKNILNCMTKPLKNWLIRHRKNPYPTKEEKMALAKQTSMTIVQVSNWFANARRRLKSTVKDPNRSWSERIRTYNENVVGNAELLSISSDDSIWQDPHSPKTEFIEDSPNENCSLKEHSYSAIMSSKYSVLTANESVGKYKQRMLQRYLNDTTGFVNLEQRQTTCSTALDDAYHSCCCSWASSTNGSDSGFSLDLTEKTHHNKKSTSLDLRSDLESPWNVIKAALALTDLSSKPK